MVLNPLPIQLPTNAESGPRGAGVTQTGALVGSCLTGPIEKSTGEASAVVNTLASIIKHFSANRLSNSLWMQF
jgi:hypothetical protein